MENSYEFSFNGSYADEVYGLTDYENLYYNAPEITSINGSYLPYYPVDYVYSPAYYIQPSCFFYYPVIPVEYTADYTYQTYYVNGPLYSGYYVPQYYLPTTTYYVSDYYPAYGNESQLSSFAVEPNLSTYEELEWGLNYSGNGSHNDTYEISSEFVGEEITTCDLSYEEYPEVLNEAPGDDDEKSSFPADSELDKDSVSNVPTVDEVKDVHVVDEELSRTVDTDNFGEAVDENIIEPLSAVEIRELKAHIGRTYESLKANLYNDVVRGYTDMIEFLKNFKWKYDRMQRSIREEKMRRRFDMESFYFHDDLSIMLSGDTYLDDVDNYVLYQLLGSLDMFHLKRFMELNYDKEKEHLYKKFCKGHKKTQRQMKKLQWKGTSLGPVPEDRMLEITESQFKKNFARDVKKIKVQNDVYMKYIADLLKESFSTSSAMIEQIQEFLNGEGFDLDNQLLSKNIEISISPSIKIADVVPDTSDFSLVKAGVDYNFQKTDHDRPPSMVFPDRIDENIPDLSTISSSEEKHICESPEVAEDSQPSLCSPERVEDGEKAVLTSTSMSGKMLKVLNEEVFSPDHQLITENSQLCVFSSVMVDNPITPDLLFDKESVDLEIQKNYEIHHPCTILQDNMGDNIPAVTAISLSKEGVICEYQKIVEDYPPSLSSVDRVEDGIPDVQEILNEEKLDSGHQKILGENESSMGSLDKIEGFLDTPKKFLNGEEPDSGHQMIIEQNDFSKNSGGTMENEHLSFPSVVEQESGETNCHSDPAILEPHTLAAAAKNNHRKNRFSSFRKFLSRVCCCSKRPPS